MYFEFLEGPGLSTIMTKKVSQFSDLNTYKQKLNDDGLFMYYCLQIKTKSTLLAEDSSMDLSIRVYCDFIDGN